MLGATALALLHAGANRKTRNLKRSGLSMIPGHAFAVSTATSMSQQVGFGAALITRTLAASLTPLARFGA